MQEAGEERDREQERQRQRERDKEGERQRQRERKKTVLNFKELTLMRKKETVEGQRP